MQSSLKNPYRIYSFAPISESQQIQTHKAKHFVSHHNIERMKDLIKKITMPGNQLYTKLCNKYVANFTSLMRRENQQIQLMLILCYPVI